MQRVVPSYYKDFICINKSCRHNCCVGWEIDIDSLTAARYKAQTGEMGKRLSDNIAWENPPHFILDKKERCPFLNNCNLCDIIIFQGEEALCEICREHPRFHNELPGRIESGIGLCCEAAARLILSQKDKVSLEITGEKECDDEIISLRDEIIILLQNRAFPLEKRFEAVFSLFHNEVTFPAEDFLWDFLLSLERLDDSWTDLLVLLKKSKKSDVTAFSQHMKDRLSEYENLAVYFIYRHLANAPDIFQAQVRALFAAVVCKIIFKAGNALYLKNSSFDFEAQVELARLFSSEIEYSDENLYELFDMLSEGVKQNEF